jgi:hypothetical protein
VVVRPQGRVFFSIGTATAYQGGRHILILTRLSVGLPRTRSLNAVQIDLPATRFPGRKIPIGITAITASPR